MARLFKPQWWAATFAATMLATPVMPAFPAIAQTAPVAKAPNPAMPLYTSFEVIEAIKQGGYVMLIRHERTEVPSRADDYTRPPAECRAQRNLSVAGVVSASENGALLRAAKIPVSYVIASPMCRGAETARYMFGVNFDMDMRLMHHDPSPDSKRPLDQAAKETRELISELASFSDDTNVALVSHGGNIFKSTGLKLTEGEFGVLKVDEKGEITVIGQFTGSTLGFYIRMKQAEEAAGEKE